MEFWCRFGGVIRGEDEMEDSGEDEGGVEESDIVAALQDVLDKPDLRY